MSNVPVHELNTLPITGPGGTFITYEGPPYPLYTSATLTCDGNYDIPDSFTSTVVSNQGRLEWDPAEIHCVPALRDLPVTGRGGQFTTIPDTYPYLEGHEAVLTCGEGYKAPADASSIASLRNDGTLAWVPPEIQCDPISQLVELPETQKSNTFRCDTDPPYHLHDRAVLRCQPPGYMPPFNLQSRVVLQNGTLAWEPARIDCIPRPCRRAPDIPHGKPDHQNFYYPETIRYQCEDGFRLNHPVHQFTCGPTGVWDPALPADLACEPIHADCPELHDPENGYITTVSKLFVFFTCDIGYAMTKGQTQRVCQKDGTWSGEEVECDQLPCPPMDPSVSVKSQTKHRDTSRLMYNEVDCGEGKTVRVPCLPTGRWYYKHPYCNHELENDRTLNFDAVRRSVAPPSLPAPGSTQTSPPPSTKKQPPPQAPVRVPSVSYSWFPLILLLLGLLVTLCVASLRLVWMRN